MMPATHEQRAAMTPKRKPMSNRGSVKIPRDRLRRQAALHWAGRFASFDDYLRARSCYHTLHLLFASDYGPEADYFKRLYDIVDRLTTRAIKRPRKVAP